GDRQAAAPDGEVGADLLAVQREATGFDAGHPGVVGDGHAGAGEAAPQCDRSGGGEPVAQRPGRHQPDLDVGPCGGEFGGGFDAGQTAADDGDGSTGGRRAPGGGAPAGTGGVGD